MSKMTSAVFVLIGLAVLTGAALLLLVNYQQPKVDAAFYQSNHIAQAGSYTNICGLNVKQGAVKATLKVRAQLTSGSMDWSLTDPDGTLRWQGHADAGQGAQVEKSFNAPQAGTWKIEVRITSAAGDYQTPWRVE